MGLWGCNMGDPAQQQEVHGQDVRTIFGPGIYNFHTNEKPPITGIAAHLDDKFPKISGQYFNNASHRGGHSEIDSLFPIEDWTDGGGTVYLTSGNQFYLFGQNFRTLGGKANGILRLEDIGEFSLSERGFEKSEFDGNLSLEYRGRITDEKKHPDLAYTFYVRGHNPGGLVLATIDYINKELKKKRYFYLQRIFIQLIKHNLIFYYISLQHH